jgi:hypothetical protein
VDIEYGLVETEGRGNALSQAGKTCLDEHDRIYIRLHNKGREVIFVNVLNINVAGSIALISGGFTKGIELAPGQIHILGAHRHEGLYKGLKLSWPENVSRNRWVGETLVFVLTNSGVDLGNWLEATSHQESLPYHARGLQISEVSL